jgi:hypothetical protein
MVCFSETMNLLVVLCVADFEKQKMVCIVFPLVLVKMPP